MANKTKLTNQQIRLINENPHLQAGKLAIACGCTIAQVKYQRRNIKREWTYSGKGIPFMTFDCSDKPHWSIVKCCKRIAKCSNLQRAIQLVDHLIWCIENQMFNQPRIENPYFENLRLGDL